MLGGLQHYALHREAVGSGRMTEKAYHDAVLSCHSIPLEMVRAELLDLPLSRDFRPALAVRRLRCPTDIDRGSPHPFPISLEASHGRSVEPLDDPEPPPGLREPVDPRSARTRC